MRKIILILLIFSCLITYADASTYIPCTTEEANAGTCFDCGTTCVARYSETITANNTTEGTLIVSGTGEMNTYEHPYNDEQERYQSSAPWKNLDQNITNVIVEEGITSVSGFYNHSQLQSVSLPNSLTKIGRASFQFCTNLADVTIPPNVTTIGHAAFYATAIEHFTIPENYRKINGGNTSYNTHLFGSNALKSITIEGNADFNKAMLDGANLTKLTGIYCETSNENCRNLLSDSDIGTKIKFYEKFGDQYFFEGKFYSALDDIVERNYDKKRIYTLEEAEKILKSIGKDHVTFRIRYK